MAGRRNWHRKRFGHWPGCLLGSLCILTATGCQTTDQASSAVISPGTRSCDHANAAVFLFITTDCPVSNGYAPEIGCLIKRYKSVVCPFFIVYVDPSTSQADAEAHARRYGLDAAVLLDPDHEMVKRMGVTVTPEAVVVDCPPGETEPLYVGRIDNLYAAPGSRRSKATTHELASAIEAVLAGRPVAVPRTEAVGCPIADMR